MLLETYDWGLEARTLQILFGLGLGLAFGIAAQISRFCLRRAVASDDGPDRSAAAVWVMGLAAAIGGMHVAASFGLVDVSSHRFASADLPLAAILIGGLAFGAGMVLTRGCISRLTVLSASGNLRALFVIATFAILAHATIKGVLSPLRTALGEFQVTVPMAQLSDITGFAPAVAALLAVGALYVAWRSGTAWRDMVLGAVIGLVVVGGWATTSVLLMDEFDPLPVQSAAFTLPWSDTLFWAIASTAIPAGFGVAWIGGVLIGAFLSAAARGEFAFASFESPRQTGRYLTGGALMGVGGVLAGGCTVGAGLAGGAMLSVAALVALAAIIFGAVATRQVLSLSGAAKPA
ncbi:MAG: YeeE/YedE family protein [Pseudomonadota bacterium]